MEQIGLLFPDSDLPPIGTVVRLVPKNPDDWHVVGILVESDPCTIVVATLSHGAQVILREPRAEVIRVEELDEDPNDYRPKRSSY